MIRLNSHSELTVQLYLYTKRYSFLKYTQVMHFSPLVGLYEIQKVKFKPQVYEQSPEGIKRSNKLAVKFKKK